MFYRTCPRCGSNLDPCERCDCDKRETRSAETNSKAEGENHGKHLSTDIPKAKTAKR